MLKRWREWLKNLTKPFLFLAVPVAIALLFLVLWKVPQWQGQSFRARFDPELVKKLDADKQIQLEKDLITAETNARITLAQILGGLALLSGLYLTWRNVRVAEEGKLTDRFSKAVELLGSKELDVRLGGIYALERIARDSQKDHWTVMEVLTASVREHAKKLTKLNAETPEIATDIQAILTVIGRRKWAVQERLHQKLDLSGANLSGANLSGANLSRATLNGADLSGAMLIKADFSEAMLIKADFSGAILIGADLSETVLQEAILSKAIHNEADFNGAILIGADLSGAYLTRAKNLTWEQISDANIDDESKLPPKIENEHKDEVEVLREITLNREYR